MDWEFETSRRVEPLIFLGGGGERAKVQNCDCGVHEVFVNKFTCNPMKRIHGNHWFWEIEACQSLTLEIILDSTLSHTDKMIFLGK